MAMTEALTEGQSDGVEYPWSEMALSVVEPP